MGVNKLFYIVKMSEIHVRAFMNDTYDKENTMCIFR